jgi:hypothetical protein
MNIDTNRSEAVFRCNARVEFRALAEEGGVLLHLDTGAYHGLDEVGSLIWELLDGRTASEVVAQLCQRYEDAPPTLEEDTREFLARLVERDLIVSERAAGPDAGASERQTT